MTFQRLPLAALLFLATGSGAVQFRVTHTTLSAARYGVVGAAWGSAAVFAGGDSGGARVADTFANGTFAGSVALGIPGTDAIAAIAVAAPGVAAILAGRDFQFLDLRTRVAHPFNASGSVPYGANVRGSSLSAGSRTTGLAAFVFHTSPSRHRVLRLVDVGVRAPTGVALLLERSWVALVCATDSAGAEYFVIAGGTNATSTPVADVGVLPVGAPTAFVGTPSVLTTPRNRPVCAAVPPNRVVCVGGLDWAGNDIPTGDTCTLSTAGILTCTEFAVATPDPQPSVLSSRWSDYSLLPFGPFVATVDNGGIGGAVVFDDTLDQWQLAAPLWRNAHGFGAAAVQGGATAYYAGGIRTGADFYTATSDDVTIVECIAPCSGALVPPPPPPPKSTSGGSTGSSRGTARTSNATANFITAIAAWAAAATVLC